MATSAIAKNSFGYEGIYGEEWVHTAHKGGLHGCIVHGIGEHCGRYQDCIPTLLKDQRMRTILTWDHYGHGRSPGRRGDAPGGFLRLTKDMGNIFRTHPDTDWVWGHSLGGLLLLEVLQNVSDIPPALKSVVLSSVPFVLGQKPSMLQKMALPLASLVLPQITLSTRLSAFQISTTPEEQTRYAKDKLVHDRMSVRMYIDLLDGIENYVLKVIRLLRRNHTLRMCFLHGAKDTIALVESMETLQKAIAHEPVDIQKRVGFHIYPFSAHEVHHDKNRDAFFQDMLAWVLEAPRT